MPVWLLASSSASAESASIFRELVIILLAASVVAIFLQRLKLATIPAYLITGALIGPGAIGIIKDVARAEQVSELALILLMFGVGLHLDLNALAMTIRKIVALTVGAFVLCTLALWPLAGLLSLSTPSALVVAMAMAMSSTAVVLRVLQQRHEMALPEGRLAVAILIIQDLIAIAVMLILPPIARWNGTGGGGLVKLQAEPSTWQLVENLALNGVIAAVGVALLFMLGKYVVPRILNEAARLKSAEVLTVVSAATALGAAVLTQIVGLNPALGAFLAGFLLAATPFRHHLGSQVVAFRDVFAAVFFTAVGMRVSLPLLFGSLPAILAATAAILSVKTLFIGFTCWCFGSSPRTATSAGVTLSQAGEFSIVLLAAAAAPALALIDEKALSFCIAVIVLTLIVTPSLIQLAHAAARHIPTRPLAPWLRDPDSIEAVPTATPSGTGGPGAPTHHDQSHAHKRAIIAGYGLVGRVVADKLKSLGMQSVIVEMNPATVAKQSALGRSVVFGDIANPETLESVGITYADALILTIPDEETVLRACKLAREMNPTIAIIARTSFMSRGITAATLGATGVVVEEMATAEAMESMVAKVLTMPPAAP
jgi:monovalent cation:H+ antiporter-2, CPA2 family